MVSSTSSEEDYSLFLLVRKVGAVAAFPSIENLYCLLASDSSLTTVAVRKSFDTVPIYTLNCIGTRVLPSFLRFSIRAWPFRRHLSYGVLLGFLLGCEPRRCCRELRKGRHDP